MYACICHAVPEAHLRTAVRDGRVRSLDDLRTHLGAGTACGRCGDHVAIILDEETCELDASVTLDVA